MTPEKRKGRNRKVEAARRGETWVAGIGVCWIMFPSLTTREYRGGGKLSSL